MQREGETFCGQAAPGQTVTSTSFLLEHGYCYTFLGESLPPIQEMDMQLESEPGTLSPEPTLARAPEALGYRTPGPTREHR